MNGARFVGMVRREGHGRTVLEGAIAMDLRNVNPTRHGGDPWCWSFGSVDVAIGSLLRSENTGPVAVAERGRRVEDLDLPAAARHRAPRFAFARLAGMVHTRPARSISSHNGRRPSPIAPQSWSHPATAAPCSLTARSLSSMRGPCPDLVPRRPAAAYVRTLVPQRPVGAARPRRRQPRRYRPECRGGPRAGAHRALSDVGRRPHWVNASCQAPH